MQLQQAGGGGRQAAAQLLPVIGVDHHPQSSTQLRLQQLALGHQQLAIAKLAITPGLHQLLRVQ